MRDPSIGSFVLIIGGMKCGTTSLFRYMKQHPQIAPSRVKEPEFFVKEPDAARTADYYRLWDWDPGRHRWALEASVAYTHTVRGPAIARRIASFGADFRFIYVVRDPIERIESLYNHAYCAGWSERDVGIDEVVERRPEFIEHTKYTQRLEPYREVFGRDRILVLNTTELAEEPLTQMEKVVGFLGLDPFAFENLTRVHNSGQGRIIEHPLIARARRHRWLFDGLRRYVPEAVQRYTRGAMGQRLTQPFKLSPESRRKILELLSDDLDRLSAEWGVDTGKWNLAPEREVSVGEAVETVEGTRGLA